MTELIKEGKIHPLRWRHPSLTQKNICRPFCIVLIECSEISFAVNYSRILGACWIYWKRFLICPKNYFRNLFAELLNFAWFLYRSRTLFGYLTYHTLGILLQFPWGVFPISWQGNMLNFETGTYFNIFWTMSGKFQCSFPSKVPLISWNFVRRLQTTLDSKRPFFWRLAEDRNINFNQEIEWRIKLIHPM